MGEKQGEDGQNSKGHQALLPEGKAQGDPWDHSAHSSETTRAQDKRVSNSTRARKKGAVGSPPQALEA